ncbi:YeeE/YedE family protein [Aureibaculum algae]|uniref:YeeE/YedE family protein n=1 Tax=Aureibaculum algae TaxID=2584122 RepID=A0A5B7TPD1_9FLAO|nr:DUF6691 family protein [Aureibaculum algae]QCX37023.1 YeeE/YedE family protein [Aureibaculum algae]
MKFIKFFVVGILFGIILSKSEVISWFRIYEMFKFQSFHMYGVIGSAVVLGILIIQLFKKGIIKNKDGKQIIVPPKKNAFKANFLGGIIFGLGWALVGACPGPMFILLGRGVLAILIIVFGALLGAFVYHAVKKWMPN